MHRIKNFIQLLVALLIGLAGVAGTLLLLSKSVSARPMLDEDNLTISKSQSSDYAHPGEQLVYTLTYQNTSSDTVSGVVITDTLDPNISYASASLTPTIAGNTLSWSIGDLTTATASGQITLCVTITSPLANGTIITNSATIDGNQTNPKTTKVTATVETATFITLTSATASITAGQSIPYTITAHGIYGSEWDATGSGVYTVTSGAGGAWTGNVYTSTVAGAWTVTGTYNTCSDTAALTVTHADAVSITLAPASATITSGQSISYTLAATDTFSNDWDATPSGAYTITSGADGTWATNVYTTAKDGAWTVTATYASLIDTAALTVTNAAPTIEDVTHSTPANEGSPVTVTITASDPETDTLTYGFDWNGNGIFTDTGDIAGQSSNQASHIWDDDGVYTITVQASDGSNTVTDTATVTINNVAPTITHLSNDSPVGEGSPATISITATDPSSDTLSYAYDWSEDGDFDDDDEDDNSYTWDDDGVHTITVQVDDGDGGVVTDTTTITVENVPPAITDLTNNSPVDENSLVIITVSATDPGDDTISYAYDWNEDGDFNDGGENYNFYTWGDDGIHTIAVRASDEDGGAVTQTTIITVENVPPVITDISNNSPVDENSPATIIVTAYDVGNDPLSYAYDWNEDGDFGDTGENVNSYTWDDDGVHPITVQVSDGDGGIVTATTTITVVNVPPTITHLSNDGPVGEGSPATVTITASDPGDDTISYAYDWNEDGDFADPGENINSHTWDDEGAHTITVRASDEDGGSVTGTTTITINNVAPTITNLTNNSPVDENSPVTITIAATDPGSDTLSYAYDWNEDGDFLDTGEITPTHTWDDDGIHAITIQVSDGDGGIVTDTTTITVVNVPPTITHLTNNSPVNESAPVTITLAATDPGSDTISYAYDWNENGDFGDSGENVNSHTWYDDGVRTIAVQVSDGDGGVVTDTTTITVVNVPPTITNLSNNSPVGEGSPATIIVSATDPGSDTLSYAYDWNEDGDFADSGETVNSYTWDDDGIHAITVQVSDGDGGSVTDTTTITVENVAPIVDAGQNQVVDEGEEVNFTGVLTDPGSGDTHTILWDFGDGATAAGVLTPTHVYTEPASIIVTLVITDDDGGIGSDVMTVTVENLAPNADAGGPYTGTAGLPVTMTASASWDPGGGPLTYTWDLDDDGQYDDGSGEVVTYTWTVGGVHTVTVQAADAQQAVGTDSAQVFINPADLSRISLTPLTATIFAWEVQTYTVEAFDVYSNSRGDVTTQTAFSIVESDHGGHWTGNIYSPQNYGDWTVQAVHTGTIVTTDTASLTVLSPSMHLEKEDDPDIVDAGAILTYTLTYSNTGNLAATNVIITDTLDPNIIFAGANPAPDGGAPDAPYWHIGDVAPNGLSQIIITATVARPLPNSTLLTNTAWIGADHVAPLSATEQTTVTSRPVLTISKESRPDPVVVGQNLVYTVIITNSGNENASSVTIVEEYDPNTSFVYASLPPDPGSYNREWTFATLAVDDSIEMDIVVRVTDTLPVGTVLTNEVTLDSDQTTPISTTETTQVLSESILEVTHVLNEPNPVPAGGELTYLIQCENTGDAPAYGVVVTATYDSRVTYLGGTNPDVGNNVWNIGTLNAGSSEYIYVEVRVDTPLPNGSVLVNLMTIDSNNTTPVGFIETTLITSSTDLAFSVTQQPTNTVEAGAPLTYTLRYTNTGNASATQVVITATFDSFAPFSSATPAPTGGTGDVRYWEIGVITGVNNYGVNGVGEIIIQTDVTLPLTNGTPLSFTTQLEGAEGDFLEDAAYATVTSAPVLSLNKSDGVSTVYAGDMLTYTLTYTNSGNENAYDVIITDTLPVSYTQYITCGITGGTCLMNDGEVIFHIPAVVAPTSGQAQLVLQVDDPLPSGANLVTNRVTMTHPSLSAPIGVQDVDLIGTLPDLTINVAHNPSTFSPGRLMTYTVTYSNTERMHAKDVVITTTLPTRATYEGYGWTSSDGETYTYMIGDLPAGDTGNRITFTAKYTDSEPQQIGVPEFNIPFTIAETGSAGGDANPSNNAANIYIGVPDLVVLDFTVFPMPLEPNVPVTFTIVMENQGTGRAENPANGGGSTLDIFTSPVESYPWERYGPIWDYIPPLAPGAKHTLIVSVNDPSNQKVIRFSEQEIREIVEFYVRVDSHADHPYGLIPESNEMNNLGDVDPRPSDCRIYLPLIQK